MLIQQTMINKLLNHLPVASAVTVPLLTIPFTSIINTIILAIIAGVVGFIVKIFLDWLKCEIKKDFPSIKKLLVNPLSLVKIFMLKLYYKYINPKCR